jgi:nitrous oxide reductase
MDDKTPKPTALSRRGFMRGAALSGAGAVSLVVGAESAEAATPSKATTGRYTETDHIRSYYRSARM